MKRALSLLALAALTACGGGGEYTLEVKKTDATTPTTPVTPVTPPTPAPVCTVEIAGDSVGDGHGVGEKPYQAIMRLRPKFTATSSSVPGETATARELRFYNENRTARFIVIQGGINDLYASPPPTGIDPVPPLRAMAAYVRAEGRTPILTGLAPQLTPHPLRAATDTRIAAMAAEYGFAFANWGTVPIVMPTEMQDTSHPTQAGSLKLVNRLIATLDALAPECRGAQ